jgi:hypothetical protein
MLYTQSSNLYLLYLDAFIAMRTDGISEQCNYEPQQRTDIPCTIIINLLLLLLLKNTVFLYWSVSIQVSSPFIWGAFHCRPIN